MTDDTNGQATDGAVDNGQVPLPPNLDELIWGKEFFDAYLSFAGQASKDNDVLNMAGMYCVLGQAIKDTVIHYKGNWADGRVNIFAIQESGTGKDAAFDFMKQIAQGSGMKVSELYSMTSAGLVGTIEKSGDVKYGAAYDSDIIGLKEASTLFLTAKNEHSADLINVMNQMLDKNGHVCKRMAKGAIEYDTRTSFFGTTYPPKYGLRYIKEGFIPRMVVCFRNVDNEYHEKIIDWMISNMGKKMDGDPDTMAKLVLTVETIKNYVKGDYFTFESYDGLRGLANDMIKIAKNYNDDVIQTAKPFLSRSIVNATKIASIHAALDRLSHTVTNEHFGQMSVFMKGVWSGTLDFIENYKPTTGDRILTDVEAAIKEMTKRGGQEVTAREVQRRTHLKSSEMGSRMTALVEMGVIETTKEVPPVGGRPSIKVKWIGY